jgi:adenylate kinase
MASIMSNHLEDKDPLFIVVLNGAFIFGADLLRKFNFECDILFIDAKSYDGLESTGKVVVEDKKIQSVKNRHVVIIEDIVDSGHTIKVLKELCEAVGCSSFEVASFLAKPSSYKVKVHVDYVGFDIAPLFVIGYGLDYNGKGRNLKDIYQIRPFVK